MWEIKEYLLFINFLWKCNVKSNLVFLNVILKKVYKIEKFIYIWIFGEYVFKWGVEDVVFFVVDGCIVVEVYFERFGFLEF